MSVGAIDTRHEVPVIGIVSFAHLLSHLYMLALPPLFPLLRTDFEVGYVELGLTITAYAVTTGLLQTPVGFLVNRIGGQRVLAAGLFVNAASIALMGVVTQYWQLVALMLLAGAGSSVFHPADYSILNARIAAGRLGRALAAHTLAGNFGFLIAPPLMVLLAAMMNWRASVILIGAVGMALAVAMLFMSSILAGEGKAKAKQADSWRELVTSPKIMLLFAFYLLSAAANSGMVHFSVVAFKEIYGLPVTATAVALTAYQGLQLLAVLPGGWLADKVENHELILALCFGASGLCVLLAGAGGLSFWLVIGLLGAAGALRGLVNASRDVSVRHAATERVSVGTLFGFVTTGFSGGQIIGPALYGWIMDLGRPELVFWASAAFSTLAIATMLVNRWTPRGT
jgi:FSR family fosmidomycin resistance protein-like MFS transporter